MASARAFIELCDAANLVPSEAAGYLGISASDLEGLLRSEVVPIHIRNALRVEAKFAKLPAPVVGSGSVKQTGLFTAISLFAGAGGLDLGLEEAGFETLFANEIEPYACETLRHNKAMASLNESEFPRWFDRSVLSQRCYSKMPVDQQLQLADRLRSAFKNNRPYLRNAKIDNRDVCELSSETILEAIGKKRGEVDLIAGGPPCQPFSRAGKKEMIDCDKGQLFMEFVRLVDEVRPRWFVFENVKGLILHKADVAELRCPSCRQVEVAEFLLRDSLKSKENVARFCRVCGLHGLHEVIWSNKRAGSLDIIRGEFERLGYHCFDTVLNAADFGAPQSRERLFIVGSRDNEKFSWPAATHFNPKLGVPPPLGLFDCRAPLKPWATVRETLYQTGHWKYGSLDPQEAVLWVKNVVRPHDEPVTWTLDRIAPTIGAHQSAKLAIAPFGVPADQLARQQWHVLGRRQGDTAPVFVEHEYLTDAELLALQTFPTSWYLHGTRMERAFQIGNAVPPILARAVGEAVIKACRLHSQNSGTDLADIASL